MILAATGAALARRVAFAQSARPARIGALSIARHTHIPSFRLGLRDAGRVEGTDFVIVERAADGVAERLADLARDLDSGAADLVLASGEAAVIATRRFVERVPAVVVSSNLVSLGIVSSYAHPGANITGFDLAFDQVAAKWPELMIELAPATRRLAVFVVAIDPPSSQFVAAAATAARLGIDAFAIEASDLAFARHFEDTVARGAGGVIVISNPIFNDARAALIAAAAAHRVPAIYENRAFPEDGGLMSYGPDLGTIFRRAGLTVDRILRGAAPASIPVELPTQFELVINLRTARAFGLSVPAALLARADAVIE